MKAEQLLEARPPENMRMDETDIFRVVHELEVYQAELEIQNDHLEETQKELQSVYNEYVKLYDSAPVGYFTINGKGIITRVNQTGASILGQKRDNLPGFPLAQYLSPQSTDTFFRHRQEAAETGAPQSCELRVERKDGSRLWVHAEILADLDNAGHLERWRLTLTDVSQRVSAEHQLRIAHDSLMARTGELQEANDKLRQEIEQRERAEQEREMMEAQLRHAQKMEAIGTLSGGIAHEFNNLLAVIMGYSDMAVEDLSRDHPLFEEMNQILRAAKRGKELVRQLLIFSRKTEPELKPMDVNLAIREAEKILKWTIPKMIVIQTEFADDLNMISGDARQIEQLLINLGTNAADAMPEGGVIHIATANVSINNMNCPTCGEAFAGEFVRVKFADTGHGMDEETLQRMFDPFFTTKGPGKGTGLGLSTVLGITSGHAGHIHGHGKPGEGTEFNIYLPKLEDEQSCSLDLKIDKWPPERGQGTVLIVDDEASLRDIISRVLTRSGYETIKARSGEQGMEIFASRNGEIDLVILDLGMPGMGGKRCLIKLLEIDPSAKILVVTGYLQYVRDELLSLGAAGFVTKPVTKTELLAEASKILKENIASGGSCPPVQPRGSA